MLDKIGEGINEGLQNAISSVIVSKQADWEKGGVPTISSIESIIDKYSYLNASISGGAGLIPGPFGMAAAVPEIVSIIRNQIAMTADIARAYGYKEPPKEIIIEALFAASGNIATGLIVIQGQKLIVKRASLSVLQKLIQILGGKITQQALKSMAAKWIPLAGATAMAAWSKYSTNKIGKKVKELFSKEIAFDEDLVETELTAVEKDEILSQIPNFINGLEKANAELANFIDEKQQIVKSKIEIFINLMKIDGYCDEREKKIIYEFIDDAKLNSDEKARLLSLTNSNEKVEVNLDVFKGNALEISTLMIDLVAIAKADEKIEMSEKIYLKSIASELNFSLEDLEMMLA